MWRISFILLPTILGFSSEATRGQHLWQKRAVCYFLSFVVVSCGRLAGRTACLCWHSPSSTFSFCFSIKICSVTQCFYVTDFHLLAFMQRTDFLFCYIILNAIFSYI